jgi:hypothetical protein
VVERLRSLWRNLVHRDRVDRDLGDEIRATFELLVDEKVRSGMDPEAARRTARLELGSADSLEEDVRDVRAGAPVDVLVQDVRYALRLLRRAPGFAAVAVATMALGIGVNAAVFGVVKSVLLDPLPYADAARLVRVYGRTLPGSRGTASRPRSDAPSSTTTARRGTSRQAARSAGPTRLASWCSPTTPGGGCSRPTLRSSAARSASTGSLGRS